MAEKRLLRILSSEFCHDSICQPPGVTTTLPEPEVESWLFFFPPDLLIAFQSLLLTEPNGSQLKEGWRMQLAHCQSQEAEHIVEGG